MTHYRQDVSLAVHLGAVQDVQMRTSLQAGKLRHAPPKEKQIVMSQAVLEVAQQVANELRALQDEYILTHFKDGVPEASKQMNQSWGQLVMFDSLYNQVNEHVEAAASLLAGGINKPVTVEMKRTVRKDAIDKTWENALITNKMSKAADKSRRAAEEARRNAAVGIIQVCWKHYRVRKVFKADSKEMLRKARKRHGTNVYLHALEDVRMQRKLAMRERAGWDNLLPQVSPRIFGDGEASAAHESQAQEHEDLTASSSDSQEAMADQNPDKPEDSLNRTKSMHIPKPKAKKAPKPKNYKWKERLEELSQPHIPRGAAIERGDASTQKWTAKAQAVGRAAIAFRTPDKTFGVKGKQAAPKITDDEHDHILSLMAKKTKMLQSAVRNFQNLDGVLDKWVEGHRPEINSIVEKGDMSALDSMDALLEAEIEDGHLGAGEMLVSLTAMWKALKGSLMSARAAMKAMPEPLLKVLRQHEEADREAGEALEKTDDTKLWHQISGSISASSVALGKVNPFVLVHRGHMKAKRAKIAKGLPVTQKNLKVTSDYQKPAGSLVATETDSGTAEGLVYMQQQDDIAPGKAESAALVAADQSHSEGDPVVLGERFRDKLPAAMPHPEAPGQQALNPEETGANQNGSTAIAIEPAALGRDFQQQLVELQAPLKSSPASESPMHPVAFPENTSMPPPSNGNVPTLLAPTKTEVKKDSLSPASPIATNMSPQLSEEPVSADASRQRDSTLAPQAKPPAISNGNLSSEPAPTQSEVKRDAPVPVSAVAAKVSPQLLENPVSTAASGQEDSTMEPQAELKQQQPLPQHPPSQDATDVPCIAVGITETAAAPHLDSTTSISNGHLGGEKPRSEDLVHVGLSVHLQTSSTHEAPAVDWCEQATIQQAAVGNTIETASGMTTVIMADEQSVRVESDNVLVNSSLKEAQEAKAAMAKASSSRARAEAYFNRHKDSSTPSKPRTMAALLENQEAATRSPDETRKQEPQALECLHQENSGTQASTGAGLQAPKGPLALSTGPNGTAVQILWQEDLSPAAQALANQEWVEDTAAVPTPNRQNVYEETSSKSISGWKDPSTPIVAHPSPKTPVPPTPGQGPRARREFLPSRGPSMTSQASASLQSPGSPGAPTRSHSAARSSMQSRPGTVPRAEATSPRSKHQEQQQQPQHHVEVSGLESSEGLGTQDPNVEISAMPPPAGIKTSESYLEETTPHQNHATLPPMKERPLAPSPPNLSLNLDSLNRQIPEGLPSPRLPELPMQSQACDAAIQKTPGLSDQLEPSPLASSWSVGREKLPRGSSASQPSHAPEPGEQLAAEQVSSPAGKRLDRKQQQQTQQREAHLQSRDSRPSTSSSSTYYGHSMQEADALLDAEMRRRALLHGMIQLSEKQQEQRGSQTPTITQRSQQLQHQKQSSTSFRSSQHKHPAGNRRRSEDVSSEMPWSTLPSPEANRRVSTSDMSIFSDDHGKGFSGISRSLQSRPPLRTSSPVMVMTGSSNGSSRHVIPEPPTLLPLSEGAPSELPSAFPAARTPAAYQTRHNSITLRTKNSRKYDSSTNPDDLLGSTYADHNGSMFVRRRPPVSSLSNRSLMQQTSQHELQPTASRGRHSLDSAFPSDPAHASQHEVGLLSSGYQAPQLVRKAPVQAGSSLKDATAFFGVPGKATEWHGSRPNTTSGFGGIHGQHRPVSRSSDDIWNSQAFGRRTRRLSRPVPSYH